MSNLVEIFSIRLVIADFYMEKPLTGFDPNYSELRGQDIKKVPVIRIFGSNAAGQKTCLHVHGVFPYFYIPYDKKNFDSIERATFQVAIHLDKAINVSLGQANSNTQHVYKVELVKGIPFYGYHRKNHQFLKIYMFNPLFIRRAANLVQSGAILNKNFSAHESHVSYILQFMIDYNLYGMSDLHMPLEVVKFRRKSENEVVLYNNVEVHKLHDVKKISCCLLELDVCSNFILNRFHIVANSNATHTNPGIEAIWYDERVRRRNLAESYKDDKQKLNSLPILEIPLTQERSNVEISQSDIFFRTALLNKLLTTIELCNTSSNHSTNVLLQTSTKERSSTFNLQKLLVNAVYPEECTKEELEQLANASLIPNHTWKNNFTEQRNQQDQDFFNNTLTDETVLLSQTQSPNVTFNDYEEELLHVLYKLEEHNENDSPIDLDSSLAPLSQSHNNLDISSKVVYQEETKTSARVNEIVLNGASDSEEDVSTDNVHDFSIALDDLDELLLNITQSQSNQQHVTTSALESSPQAFDHTTPATPIKSAKKSIKTSPPHIPVTPKQRTMKLQSPRTPKSCSAKKYVPLPLVFENKSSQKQHDKNGSTCLSSQFTKCSDRLQRKIANNEIHRKILSLPTKLNETPELKSNAGIGNCQLEKTIISCSLQSIKREQHLNNAFEDIEKIRPSLCSLPHNRSLEASTVLKSEMKTTRSHSKVNINFAHNCLNILEQNASTAESAISQEVKLVKDQANDNAADNISVSTLTTGILLYSKEGDEPSIQNTNCNTSNSSEDFITSLLLQNIHGLRTTTAIVSASVVLTPSEVSPSYTEVKEGCRKLNIGDHKFQMPFYKNPADKTKIKEVGFLVLQIPGNKLNDFDVFYSNVNPGKGLIAWRRQLLVSLRGPAILQRYRSEQQLRAYFSIEQRFIIEPKIYAPRKIDAKVWLKSQCSITLVKGEVSNKKCQKNIDEDSPIKVKRQKITMTLNTNEDDGHISASDELTSKNSMVLKPSTTDILKMSPHHASTNSIDSKLEKSLHNKRRKCDSRLVFHSQPNQTKSNIISNTQNTNSASESNEYSKNSSSIGRAEAAASSFMHELKSYIAYKDYESSFDHTLTSLNNSFGFKVNLENLQQAKADVQCNYLTTISLEVFVRTRANLLPDPFYDEICCIFYAVAHSVPNSELPSNACGYIIVNDTSDIVREGYNHGIDADIEIQVVASEIEVLEALLAVCARWDADIYAGYEIEMSSWGYVIDRAKRLCFNLTPLLSRVPSQKTRDFVDEDHEQFTDLDVEMKICGRIMLDLWRLMRSEIALTSYTFENVMYQIMHKRCPWYTHRSLTTWFDAPSTRWIVLEYYLERVRGSLALLEQLDLLGRTSEMAKLIGIQFYEVLSRGSQFRVESMMLRIAKPKNLVPLSPSVQQRAHMRAPEYLPLILEPQSRFYSDPIIVLDFQSLYPSMIIAYNYCFSTCLGRVEHLGQSTPFEFGASQLRIPSTLVKRLLDRNLINMSPCGVAFVKKEVREGILPRMLSEILNTRQMVKQSMKLHRNNTALQRILHSRQLGLKLMANVTYGYTAANFSGRMPAVEVGDSVLSKARETLERAIKLVEMNEDWNVRVVYGDTDSLFILVPERDRTQAFHIGEEIVEAVNKINPHPVKLKLEKVYQPCILQTKKRYVGYMYENADQMKPVYEAKGIETVRRDGCPAVSKILEKVLRILFEDKDVSRVKKYVCRQFSKLLSGRTNLQDLIFAKEFRGLNGYKPTACVPALEMTRLWLQSDPRRIPRRGERVPFIVINGPPGVPLIKLVRSPHELLENEGYKINGIYYITKALIPPLNRCLLLIGADVSEWFTALPRKLLLTTTAPSTGSEFNMQAHAAPNCTSKKFTISQYFTTTNCVTECGRQTKEGVCSECAMNASNAIVLHSQMAILEQGYHFTQQICQSCCGRAGDLKCSSLDCPVLYVLEVKRRDLHKVPYFRRLLEARF